AHAFQLLGDVLDVELREFARSQESGLLHGPGEEIRIVSGRIARHQPNSWEALRIVTSHCASRTVARALRPAASITVNCAKPSASGRQKRVRRGIAGGNGRPSTSQRNGPRPPMASSGNA